MNPQAAREFERRIKGLPAYQARVARTIYLYGLSTTEAARVLGIPVERITRTQLQILAALLHPTRLRIHRGTAAP